jgi:hypothetical protein
MSFIGRESGVGCRVSEQKQQSPTPDPRNATPEEK